MQNIDIKHALYKQVSLIGKALGHETRLEIIEILSQCPQTVEKISDLLSTDIKSVSAHLKVLSRAGLVSAQREGRFMRYSILDSDITHLAVLLRETAQRTIKPLTELMHSAPPAQTPMPIEEAVNGARDGRVLLIDVRPSEEFAAGHLPHAVNMPLGELGLNIYNLPNDIELAAYCRGSFCFKAREAAKIFAQHGRCLHVIPTGVMEWVSQGKKLDTEQQI